MIYSIFNETFATAAEIMIKRGKGRKIPLEEFPPSAPVVDEAGRQALFAVLIPDDHIDEFSDVVNDLRI